MRRREFITLLGGAAAAWPLAARAQADRVRRIGVLLGWSESKPEVRSWLEAFMRELMLLGWADGHNVAMDVRWTDYNNDRARTLAKELVASQPDVILCGTTPATAALQQETRTIPIVFAGGADPVGSGFVASLPHPGANITGFANYDGAIAGKWLQMIKEIAPRVTRVAAIYNPDTAPFAQSILDPFKTTAKSLGVELSITEVRSDREIEASMDTLERGQVGLVAITDSFIQGHLATIIAAANRNQVPAIFEGDAFPRAGGLLSYGASFADLFRRAAGYVDRILKGEKPSDLPVQMPTRYELIINLKTAKALGLTVPPPMLAIADEVIE
jgi:putative ABC transport system substrate-binding protein